MYDQYNVVSRHPFIPKEAFLFQPFYSGSAATRDDFKIGEGKSIRRLIFDGWAEQTYSQYQLQKLKEFDEYLIKKNIRLDPRWNKCWKIRWLLSVGCNNKKCVQEMQAYIEYQEKIKNLEINQKIQSYLKQGVFYLSGRDCHYRPIMVFDVDKIIKLKMSQEELLETQTYFFEHVMRNCLIPGQIENWVAIIDGGFHGLLSLASTMKKSFNFLSTTFRSRMFVCYVVRCPPSLSFLWGIVKRFLEEETIKKINFFDQPKIDPLFEFCNQNQVQIRFGGKLPNIEDNSYWPPKQHSKMYKCQKEPVTMLFKQEYIQYYREKRLYNTKFHEDLITEQSPASLQHAKLDQPVVKSQRVNSEQNASIQKKQLSQNYNFENLKAIEKSFLAKMHNFIEDEISNYHIFSKFSAFPTKQINK